MAYYRQSREPENIGQNIDVFRPLPSLHQQNRQRKQTGYLPQFGFSDIGASSYHHHQAPARERLTAYVNGFNATTTSSQKRATSVSSSDDEEESPPKRGRGRPQKNQNVPPQSYTRRSTDREYYPKRNYNHQAYSRDNRNDERNTPYRNGRRSADPAMKRARSREPYNRDHIYADNQRGRSQGPEYHVDPRRSTRSSERQPRRTTEQYASQSRRSVEAIDSPQQQQPASSAPSLQQRRPIIRSLENKEPSVASMVLRLYAPSDQNVYFAPNIFAYPSIRENVSGLNIIGDIIDAAGKYKEQKRGKKF